MADLDSIVPQSDLSVTNVLTTDDVSASCSLLHASDEDVQLLLECHRLLYDVHMVERLFEEEARDDRRAAEQWSLQQDALDFDVCDRLWVLAETSDWIEGMSDEPPMPSGRRFEEAWRRYCVIQRAEAVPTQADFERYVHHRY